MRRADVRWMLGTGAFALLAGCGGGGGSGGGSTPVAVVTTPSPTPTPTPTPVVTPTPTATPTPTPTVTVTVFPAAPATPASWAAGLAAEYDVVPDVAACRTGTLKASVKADVLLRVNAVRALHGLAAVTYADADDEQTAQSSLMMVANQQLSHTPPTTWTCYTAAGAAGAGSGNLFAGTGSTGAPFISDDTVVANWMTEINSASIGHRRWMLDPYLGKVSYGRVARTLAGGGYYDAATLKVFNFTGGVAAPGALPAYVAYPQGDYPARYMDAGAFLSFSVVGATRTASAAVRFANAVVAVSAGGQALAVSGVAFDNDGYGVPNSIQWKVAGLQSNVTYTVRISGVTGAPAGEYTYSFRLVP